MVYVNPISKNFEMKAEVQYEFESLHIFLWKST